MYVIVGLGNPGKKYEGTRHNVGFDVVEYLGYRNNIDIKKIKHKALIGEGMIEGKKVMLVKPQTFMNLSGESVLEICRYYDVDFNKLIVIYDDIDIDFGKIRIRKKGSAGTHNGMRNIIYNLQSDEFPRIRIGIGKPEKGDLVSYVIGKFKDDEKEDILISIKTAACALECIIREGIDKAMNMYNK
ncbi:peptidyl-tRNA hydrolase, PTH1 family [Caminicella sporogenes DSM 14501]|uniref:Peptidyl-tRNA hydrolase n=1 Tax=Caminicella sporogenes DSM 14501 TaxID=1121266 RepID=A0A1M6QTS5_9FIRM|nr:aminoacyl-tRNA hydrolase [Caminicella sporogenes]RKD20915.1 aminoacyl-tRNA hydrolase [Caminicella sporogenes]WIF95679.1 aminoacyl-tRNA hydrolase [Caminicella sporogenes]SHK23606.1 peptidyl-tRNA hydrolase, PTH1 family [Caminicella sporogenes DSM 14501]